MEKILELFKSSDPSNHLIALSLIKGLELDLHQIVAKIFHNKEYWVFDRYKNYDLKIYDFNFCFHNANCCLSVYNLTEFKHPIVEECHNYFSSEDEIIQFITNLIKSILSQPNQESEM